MLTRAEIKQKSKKQISGNVGICFLCLLVMGLIISISSIVSPLIIPSLSIGMIVVYLKITSDQKPEVGDLFKGFNYFGKALWLNIITAIFTFLWSLLLLIPGLIKAISYSFAPYILAENPELTAREALAESKRLTKGHCADLFVLYFSFIGWMLLVPLTLGLIMIWLVPYLQTSFLNYYHEIKKNDARMSSGEFKGVANAADAEQDFVTRPMYDEQPVREFKTEPSFVEKKGAVAGLEGAYANATIPLDSNEEILFGTSGANCQIVFEKSIGGIADRHLGIKYDSASDKYIVKGYSDFGTAVGSKVIGAGKAVEAPHGVRISFGTPAQTFILN